MTCAYDPHSAQQPPTHTPPTAQHPQPPTHQPQWVGHTPWTTPTPRTTTPTPAALHATLHHTTTPTDNHWACNPTTWTDVVAQQPNDTTDDDNGHHTLLGLGVLITTQVDGIHLIPHPHGHGWAPPRDRRNH